MLEVWTAPLAFVYIHESLQYVFLGVDIILKLEGGYVVLEHLARPRRPRLPMLAGLLMPAVIALAVWPYVPLFAAIMFLAVVGTAIRYVGG